MASRWMAPKLAKMAAARKALRTPDLTNNRPGHTIEASNRLTAQLAMMRQQYQGVVTLCEPGRPLTPQGKGKRQHNAPFALERMFGRNDRRGGERIGASAPGAQSFDHDNGLIRDGKWVA